MKKLLIISCIFLYSPLIGSRLKTSIIIPCHYRHAIHLDELLKLYERQTVLPDEVVISLSESDKVSSEIIDNLNNGPWSFPVKLICSTKKQYAGTNRNIACDHATGDIFIAQDADDIPHPQRVEIIKYIFEKHSIDHLMHSWILGKSHQNNDFARFDDFIYSNMDLVPLIYTKSFQESWLHHTTNGNIAISKEVFTKIRWSGRRTGQDVEFNTKVYQNFKKTVIVKVPLLIYRNYLSTGPYRSLKLLLVGIIEISPRQAFDLLWKIKEISQN